MLEDGEPNDPAAFLPQSRIGKSVRPSLTARGDEWRILAIDTEINEELIDASFNGTWLGRTRLVVTSHPLCRI
jgi:hypothetical protein